MLSRRVVGNSLEERCAAYMKGVYRAEISSSAVPSNDVVAISGKDFYQLQEY